MDGSDQTKHCGGVVRFETAGYSERYGAVVAVKTCSFNPTAKQRSAMGGRLVVCLHQARTHTHTHTHTHVGRGILRI